MGKRQDGSPGVPRNSCHVRRCRIPRYGRRPARAGIAATASNVAASRAQAVPNGTTQRCTDRYPLSQTSNSPDQVGSVSTVPHWWTQGSRQHLHTNRCRVVVPKRRSSFTHPHGLDLGTGGVTRLVEIPRATTPDSRYSVVMSICTAPAESLSSAMLSLPHGALSGLSIRTN